MKTRWQALSNGHWLQVWELRQRRVEEAGVWRPISLLLCGMALLLGLQNPLLYGMAPGFDASLFAAMGKNPVILGGDMNENLTAPAMQRFTAKLKDTLMNRAEDTAGTVPSNAPRRRIDYILAADMFETVSSTIVFNDITRIASDHLPYAVVLRQSAPAE